jgi:uncharacterized protein (DUF697 family)
MTTEDTKHILSGLGSDKRNALVVSLRKKRRKALRITGQHTIGNMVLAAFPIPFSDAPFLAISEGVLVARILYVYDLDRSLGALTGIFGSIGGTLISSVGMMTAASLLKCFPGAGSVVGGIINASVAGTFTTVLGLVTIGVCEYSLLQAAQGEESDLEAFLNNFNGELENALHRAFQNARKTNLSCTDQEGWA